MKTLVVRMKKVIKIKAIIKTLSMTIYIFLHDLVPTNHE